MKSHAQLEKVVNLLSALDIDDELKLYLMQTAYDYYVRDEALNEINRIKRKSAR